MLVAYDCIPLATPLSGIGRYTHALGTALQRARPAWRWQYFHGGRFHPTLPPQPTATTDLTTRRGVIALAKQIPAARRFGRWAKGQLLEWSHPPGGFDLYLEPNFVPIEQVRARSVIATLHDLSFRRQPDWHPADRIEWFEQSYQRIAERSDRILVDSEFIRGEALADGLPADKLVVVHPGCDGSRFRELAPDDAATVRERHELPDRFVLFVGTLEPRKNLQRLLDAWLQLEPGLRREVGLVLVGGRGWGDDGFARRVKSLAGEGVTRLRNVDDEDLVRLLNLADALVYPTLYEGFGLPPLEAMACGCPVVVSRAASLPEVCGDAALYFDPHDTADLTDALSRQLLERGRVGPHVATGRTRAARFTWDAAAGRVAALAEGLAGSRSAAPDGAATNASA